MHAGPLLAFPVQNLRVSVTSLSLGSVASLPVLSTCVADCVSKALREAEVQLLEPYTSVVVTVLEEHLGAVLSDLTSQRRGQVKEVASLQDSREITAFTPLACLMVSVYTIVYVADIIYVISLTLSLSLSISFLSAISPLSLSTGILHYIKNFDQWYGNFLCNIFTLRTCQ